MVEHTRGRRLMGLSLLGALAMVAAPALADTSAPSKTVSSLCDTLLSVMKDAKQLGYKGRYDKLAPVIDADFNLPTMARLATGPTWSTLSAAQQKSIVDAFRDYTVATYASRFDGYSGEQFQIGAEHPPSANGTVVDTKLIPSNKKDPITLNYLTRKEGQDWRIVDIYLTGTISQLAQYRSEFSSIIQRQGVDGLVKMLKDKSAAAAG